MKITTPMTMVGDVRHRSVFCLFPKTFTVRNPVTKRREWVTYWLETIVIKEEWVLGGWGSPSWWHPEEVNGQSCTGGN